MNTEQLLDEMLKQKDIALHYDQLVRNLIAYGCVISTAFTVGQWVMMLIVLKIVGVW